MTAKSPLFPKDLSRLSFEEWVAYLQSKAHKPAVQKLLQAIAGWEIPEKLNLYRKWIRLAEIEKEWCASIGSDRGERYAINERYKSQPGYLAILKDPTYLEIMAKLEAARSRYHSLARDRGWDVVDGCLGQVPDEELSRIEAKSELDREKKSFFAELALLKARYQITYEHPRLPNDWQGQAPNHDVESLPDLLRYLQRELKEDHNLESLNEAIHNAYCILPWLEVRDAPQMVGYPFTDVREAKAFVTNLVMRLSHQDLESGDERSNVEILPESLPVDNAPVSGFLGLTELAKVLSVHDSRLHAFAKRLERARRTTGAGTMWKKTESPKPHESRYLYRADDPEVVKAARGLSVS